MNRLMSPATRGKALGLKEAGWSFAKIAVHLGVTKGAISKLVAKAKDKGADLAVKGDYRKVGQPKLFSEEQSAFLRRIVEDNPFMSAAQIKRREDGRAGLQDVSVRRIRENLQKQGLGAKKAAKKPALNERMIRQRLEWCEEHRGKTEEDWMKVLFSDESKFVQIRNNSRMVRRPPKTRFDPRYTIKTVKHPASVMVWGCFDGIVGRRRLFFLPKKTTMNKERYVAML